MTQPKNVDEMTIEELEDEHRTLKKRIDYRRERMKQPYKKLSLKANDKLMALLNDLYGKE